MRVRKANHLALSLLVAAGLGVFAARVEAQTAPQHKTGSGKSDSSTHRTKSAKKSSRRRERGQKAPTPDRISEIQQALAKDGSFAGTPNGKWDDPTSDAVRKFQESHGLSPTGKLDAKTLQQLGLGSSTAGVAAPLPPISSSALKSPPAQTGQRQ